jgi:hypothetical protein
MLESGRMRSRHEPQLEHYALKVFKPRYSLMMFVSYILCDLMNKVIHGQDIIRPDPYR